MGDTYDFVIVGGGTAGLVLANRLTEDDNTKVVVLEAGSDKDQDPRVMVPGLWRANANTEQDWAFTTTPQNHLKGKSIAHMQGKMLGGSSSLNAQALIPPSATDLNAWEQIGNTGWNWKTMKPYLKNLISLSQPEQDTHDRLDLGWSKDSWSTTDPSHRGGLIKASFADVHEEGPLASAWIKTINNLGYPLTDNPFDGFSTGPYNAAATIDMATKSRVSSSTSYYEPVKQRTNLRVLTDCLVEKIIIEESADGGKTATGVTYVVQGEKNTVHAANDVIICAGVFQSPKLLELSGVGDPSILSSCGIETKVANSFVGTNLQDHILHPISFETSGTIPTRDGMIRQDPAVIQAAMKAYKTSKTGPMCSSAVTSFAYLPVDDMKHDAELREAFLSKLDQARSGPKHPLDTDRISLLRRLIENQNEGTAQYFPFLTQAPVGNPPVIQDGNFLTLIVALSHPLSSGTVHINSSDPAVPPTIDHEYLSHPLDVELQARHVCYLEKIAAAEPLASLLKKDGRRNDKAAFIGDDMDKAREFVKLAGLTNYHSVGTCAMAPKDSGGVVDSECRVYGVKNLRVVDASVMPLVPQSNTQMLVYGIAERAADIIRGRA